MAKVDTSTLDHSFAHHRRTHIKKTASEDLQSNPYLDASQRNLIALNNLLSTALSKTSSTEKQNLYSHMLAFYSMMNETFAKLKMANNDQKRDDKKDLELNQKDKEFYAWTECAINFGAALVGGPLTTTGDIGRAIAEGPINNLKQAAIGVINDKSQRKEHKVQSLDKKQDAARDRNRSIGDNDRTVRQSLAEAMRNYQRTFGEGRVNN